MGIAVIFFILWGSYTRKPLPKPSKGSLYENEITRIRCKLCLTTHAVLPTFLIGSIRHPAEIVTSYIESCNRGATIPEMYRDIDKELPDAPKSLSTLYRWFKRLTKHCGEFLATIPQKLLELSPEISLHEIEELMLVSPNNSPIKPAYLLAAKLLSTTDELLAGSPDQQSLAAFTFLNYLYYQNVGQTILSPLPRSP